VTLGLMNFINLAHGAFAMVGGYCTVILVNRLGVPFALGLPLAFLVTAIIGGFLERTLYVHVYARPHLDQVLFTIGLVFMAVAATDYTMGSSQQFVQIPEALQGQYTAFGKLIKGDDVLEKIATTPTHPGDRPVKKITLTSVKIVPVDSVK